MQDVNIFFYSTVDLSFFWYVCIKKKMVDKNNLCVKIFLELFYDTVIINTYIKED
jgi:hypothetical protein